MTDDSSKRHAASVSLHLLFWPIFIAGLVLDLLSKSVVFNWLADTPQQGFTIIKGFLYLQLAQNRGAAFGIAAGHRIMLVAVAVTALVVVFAISLFTKSHSKIFCVALALFAAGICGNLYDRLFNNGLVRDFIDVVYWPGKHWPAFNVADSMLCIAMVLLFLSSFSTHSSSQKPAQTQK